MINALEGLGEAERPTARRADSAAAPASRPSPKVPKPKTRERGDSGTRCSRGVHEVDDDDDVVVVDLCEVVGCVGFGDGIADVRVGVGSRGGVVGGGVGVGIGGSGGFGGGGDGGGGGGVITGESGGVGVGGGVGMGEDGGWGGGGGLMRWRRVRRRRVLRRLGMEVGGERAITVRPWQRRVRSVMEVMFDTIVKSEEGKELSGLG